MNRHDLYYLLGFGFLDYKQGEHGTISLTKSRHYQKVVEEISYRLFSRSSKETLVISDGTVVKFLSEHGIFTPKRYMPNVSEEYAWSFIAGYFDGYGEFSFKGDNARVFIQSPVSSVIDFIAKYWKVRVQYADKVMANGYKALDICGNMYNKNTSVCNMGRFYAFNDVLNSNQDKMADSRKKFECVKLHPSALEPTKERMTDSGFDLHIVELDKIYTTPWGGPVYQGKTQLAVKPIFGYAFDIAGRSSLPKKGWQLLQGVGICDRSYIGGIEGTFLKLNDDPLPKMPWKALQLVPRPAPIHADFVVRKDLGESDRGSMGFGSSD